MPALTTVRDAAVALLRAALPQVKKVEAFSGDMTLGAATLKNLPPEAIFVTALGARNTGLPLDFDLTASFGAFVLTRGRQNHETREKDGLALTETVALTLHGATFGLNCVSPARVLDMSPVDGEGMDSANICVWAVVWQQTLTLEEVTP